MISPFGLIGFLRKPFGLENAAQIFQRLMDSKYIRHFSFVECDDITTRSSRSFDKFIVQT